MFLSSFVRFNLRNISVETCRKTRYKNAVTVFKLTRNKCYHRSVADFYAGKSVFITGGTGFLGKAFVEKLLYSTDIEKIYMLIRETQHLRAQVRLNTILENPIFSRLKEEKPKALDKIVVIPGDIEKHNLGISLANEDVLINNVSVVIHSAATTNFNEPLLKALEINYEGTRKVLNLCKKIKNIQAYVHISTAYSNTDKKVVEEHVYPAPADVSYVYNELKRLGNDKNKISTLLIELYSLCFAHGQFYQNISSKLAVYNCGTSSINPIHLDEIFKFFNKANIKFTSNDSRFPKCFVVESKLTRDIVTFITQLLPAYIYDILLTLKGDRPRYVKLQKKFIWTRNKYEYFNRNSWIFKTDKLLNIYKNISEKDRLDFPFDMYNINWSEYMTTYAKAVQQFLKQKNALKMNANNITHSRDLQG
ncbi:PREDICTED: fatty acyl-CoA reductase 1-like [Papilio polytes]|uniref:fatty acyl-CoA reductase 1-like n=1 Tax=Papilio polytes TaxID=76194 RepID=UPI000675CF51|nr:PREDICTED: fatty acyl-CoA reductase 1-like [Papilio polytes]